MPISYSDSASQSRRSAIRRTGRRRVTTVIRIFGADWCHLTSGLRDYLTSALSPHRDGNIERDPAADEFVRTISTANHRFPIVVVGDHIVTNPTVAQLRAMLDGDQVWRKSVLRNSPRLCRCPCPGTTTDAQRAARALRRSSCSAAANRPTRNKRAAMSASGQPTIVDKAPIAVSVSNGPAGKTAVA